MDLLFAKLIVTLRADAAIGDPYTLFSLKSDFAQSFRKAACHADGRCESCRSTPECPYHATFAQELTSDPAALKRHQKPSLPFVFQPPVLPISCAKGSNVELVLVLFGSATHYLAVYWEALLHLFRHGSSAASRQFSLVKLESAGCSGFRTELAVAEGPFKSDLLTTISGVDVAALNTLDPQRILLRFETHLRIARDGGFLRKFSFSPFIRTLVRRISSLAYYYGGMLELDFKRLAAQSEVIEVVENCIHWEEWERGGQFGLIGSGVLSGDLTDFHPALLLGEYLNCGKDAPIGLGRYVLAR